MRASGINRAFMQARSLSAGPVIAASSAAGMSSGSEGNAQPASGACAITVPASAPTRIVAENRVRSIFSPRCGLLIGCVDLYKICLRREVDHHRAKRRPDQRVLIDGSAKGRAELVQTLGARHHEAKM